MSEISRPQIDATALATQIQEIVKRHRFEKEHIRDNASTLLELSISAINQQLSVIFLPSLFQMEFPQLHLQPSFEPNEEDRYHVRDLLKYHDRHFVANAYRAILKREPDVAGYESYLASLRQGLIDKIDVLASLSASPEGRSKKVRVDGLARQAALGRLNRLPYVGPLFRYLTALSRLPLLVRQQQQLVAQNQEIEDHINKISNLNTLACDYFNQLLIKQQKSLGEIDARINELNERLPNVEARSRSLVDALRAEMERVQLHVQRTSAELAMQGERTNRILEETRKELSSHDGKEILHKLAAEESHNLDALYMGLEDRFRGSRDEIKERLREYLPYLKRTASLKSATPIVDLGCGRGEWLELLKEQAYKAIGVDTNRVLINECHKRGLDVVEDDALNYLRNLHDKSIAAVTGFHIIEHLPTDVLIKLLNETLRVLKPGGLVIFETPNPENVLVGSHYFYFDPTHRNPLPSLLMQFLFEAQGLTQIEILNLHAWDSARVKGDDELTKRFNDLFYGPMDYAIIGRKISE